MNFLASSELKLSLNTIFHPMKSFERLIGKTDHVCRAPPTKSAPRVVAMSAFAIGGKGSRSVKTNPMTCPCIGSTRSIPTKSREPANT